jgi:uncharacterized protein YndB with AHSA1/START domain
MSTASTSNPSAAPLKRTYNAAVELVWEVLTTPAGVEEWWGPDGFDTRVTELDLRPEGQVRYTMTATAPDQVAFVENLGLPLSNEFRRTYTEVARPNRLAYLSLIDFVPDQEPYEHLTVIDLESVGDSTTLIMAINPLHDEAWTQEYRDHRLKELDNLDAAISRRAMDARFKPGG